MAPNQFKNFANSRNKECTLTYQRVTVIADDLKNCYRILKLIQTDCKTVHESSNARMKLSMSDRHQRIWHRIKSHL